MARPAEIVAGFAFTLRGEGLKVPPSSVQHFHRALSELGWSQLSLVYWAGRSTLITRPESIEIYDRCFDRFFRGVGDMKELVVSMPSSVLILTDEEEDESGNEDDQDRADELPVDQIISLRYSDNEVLRSKDFSEMDEAELKMAYRLIQLFRWSPPLRRSLRLVRSQNGREIDLRRTLRESMANGGELSLPAMKDRGRRRRKVVFLCDVSGSMEPYAKPVLQLAHSAVVGTERVEVFTMATRLTRVTRELQSKDPDRALKGAAAKVVDYSGGTRLGELLRKFNDLYAIRGMGRRSVVVISSDGWDRGDPTELAEEMARLKRVAHRIVWINPLKAMPGYAPLARGMAAALPFVDNFLEGHSVAALEKLVEVISQ